jgi:2,3-bisphosphoglycerate-independent phosphoglycerate mutase
MEHTRFMAREGVCGLLQTLYPDLARGSIVAQLGMLGWDPYLYYPHGRASCELLALGEVDLFDGDLVFRTNLVTMKGSRLESYNGYYILTEQAVSLVERIKAATHDSFPSFELHHNSDFRNSLVIRGAGVDPREFVCAEPHENEGVEFDVNNLVRARDGAAAPLARRINEYVACAARVLSGEMANMLFPWSASKPLSLPSFSANTGFEGRVAVVGSMDFLQGIAKAGGIDFYKVGNGRPSTDYAGKGAKVIELLDSGYDFVICHINGPDEASHMGDRELKIRCLELVDEHVVGPVVARFSHSREELGGVMIAPDHYTNYSIHDSTSRSDAHSIDPVPFALWNGRDRDAVEEFGEEEVRHGLYGDKPINHLELLRILGVARTVAAPMADLLPRAAEGRQDLLLDL